MRNVIRSICGAVMLVILFFSGCGESKQDYANAIRAAIAQDKQASAQVSGSLGLWETLTGAAPEKVEKYVGSLKAIDMNRCPQDFRTAYQAHIYAWENYATAYRAGKDVSALKKPIEDTWLVINDRAREYGVQDALK
jgi:hypothetical protein